MQTAALTAKNENENEIENGEGNDDRRKVVSDSEG